jgi:hypothetical protein
MSQAAHCAHRYHEGVEVDHGRAARAGLEDTSAAEGRIAARGGRRRQVGILAVLIVVALAGAAVLVDRTWFGPPSLAPGTRHTATLREVPTCPGAFGPELDFAGHHWWPDQDLLRIQPPVTGTLVILRRADRTAAIHPNRVTAYLLVGNIRIDLFGGSRVHRPIGCPIR